MERKPKGRIKKALITGATGFVGGHLVKELWEAGYDVYETSMSGTGLSIKMNIMDFVETHSVLRRTKPDYIFHLAAIAFVPTSWKEPNFVFETNIMGSLNLFNAVKAVGIDPVIQIAGSSEEYGLVHPDEVPIKETNPLRPLSPYAVTKIAMDYLGYQYFKSYGMKIIRTRAFNHEGYGRPESYMPSGFAKQFVEIKKGLREPVIKHGNLEAERDFTDVRDIARAYRMAAEQCEPGEVYNIGSGNRYSGRDILDKLEKITGIKPKREEDPKRMRPSDVPILVSDSSKFRKKTGWKPKFTIDNILSEELRFWRENV